MYTNAVEPARAKIVFYLIERIKATEKQEPYALLMIQYTISTN